MTPSDAPGAAWRQLLSDHSAQATGAMPNLAARFGHRMESWTQLGSMAGPRRRTEAGYRWLPYKEAFSPGLVRQILDNWPELDGPILDPFTGTGTTQLVASERGLSSVGIEMLP